MKKNIAILEEDKFYHIYNRGNNSDRLFYNNGNYEYFLRKYDHYLSGAVETYAFCLLPTHFHLLVRIIPAYEKKSLQAISSLANTTPTSLQAISSLTNTTPTSFQAISSLTNTTPTSFQAISSLLVKPLQEQQEKQSLKVMASLPEQRIEEKFRRFFITYSQAINKQQNRHGSLFEKPFRRIEISSIEYLRNLVFYIHSNPQKHGIVNDFRDYPWSSYNRILINKPSALNKESVIEWFGDKTNYLNYHTEKIEIAEIKHLLLE